LLAVVTVALGTAGGAAQAETVPLRENACLSGEPAPVGEALAACPLSAPHHEDLGRAMATVTSPDEKSAYILEQTYTVNTAGGETTQARDTIVQERLEGQEPPRFASCVSTAPTPDCSRISNRGAVFEAASEVMAPDGHNLYVASRAGVARFAIEPSGALQYAECLRSADGLTREECFAPKWSAGELETEQIAISADEKDLYLTAEERLVDIHLGAGGAMSLGHCYRFRSICPWGRAELEGEGMAALTPDGQMLVDVMSDDQVNVYKREKNGSLRFTGCITGRVYENGLPGEECPTPAGEAPALQSLDSIAVAPNSRDVYVTGGWRSGAAGTPAPVTLLHLTPAGALEFAGCWGVEVPGCATLPLPASWFSSPYKPSKRIAVSPDGSHLALATDRGNDLLHIDPASGSLSWEGCVGYEGGCEHLQAGPIAGQGGSLEFTPTGQELWMDDAGSAVRMRLGATAPAEAPPTISTSGTVENWGDTVVLCAPAPAHGAETTFYYEIEGPSGQVFYASASPDPYECEGDDLYARTHLQLGDSYRFRLIARTPSATANGPWSNFSAEPCPHPGYEGRQTAPDITPTSLTWSGTNPYGCAPHNVVLEYGETSHYGHTIPATSRSGMRLPAKEGGFYVSVNGLRPGTTYYWRLSVENSGHMEVASEGASTTTAPGAGAIETFAETGTATPQSADAVNLTGTVWSGDTPVSVTAQVFDETREGAIPIDVVSLGKLPASREPATIPVTVSGLECGRPYNWRLLSQAAYGESIGSREPFMFPCRRVPEIIKSPTSTTITEGETATFEATASGEPAPIVQWEVSRDRGGTWEAITGATSETLAEPIASASQSGYEFRAVFSNDAGSATTGIAMLTVLSKPSGPASRGEGGETASSIQTIPPLGSTGSPFAPAQQGILGQLTTGIPTASLLSRRARASRGGILGIPLRCPNADGTCIGRLTVSATLRAKRGAINPPPLLAARHYEVAAGTDGLVRIHLSPNALRLLTRKRRISAKVTLTTPVGVRTYTFTVLAPPPSIRH
jgi:hypothetical protein